MAYDYRYTQRTTTANRPGRRSLYAPPPPPSRHRSSHHGFFTYWVPLVVTGTLAIGGLAAWIWSEREHHEEDEHPQGKPPRPPPGVGKPYPTQGSQPYPGPPPPPQQQPQQGTRPPPPQGPPGSGPVNAPPGAGEAASYYDQAQSYRAGQTMESRDAQAQSQSQSQQEQDGGTWYGRVTGMMKRTPSPQQFFDSATKQVSAGVAALGSIMEDDGTGAHDARLGYDSEGRSKRRRRSDETLQRSRKEQREREKEGFSDHERWSEEAEEQRDRVGLVDAESDRRAESARTVRKGAGKAVAVVVSADTDAALASEHAEEDAGYRTEHASILSHLSAPTADQAELFVLIYMPGLQSLPPANYRPSASHASTPGVHTPASELATISPRPSSPQDSFSASPQFNALYTQSLSLVSSSTRILPFTTPDGYVHILRHLAPSLVYVSDTLSGEEGEDIARLKGWVGHTVLVAGDDGHGGLADTETETEAEDDATGKRRKKATKERWYEKSEMVGLGKDVEVVDAGRVGEDWVRRVGGRE